MDFSHKSSAKDAQSKVTSPDQDNSPATEDMDAALVQRLQRVPATLSPREVMHLQRTIGNQAVLRALNAKQTPPARITQSAPSRTVQRKLGQGMVNRIVAFITGGNVRIHYNWSSYPDDPTMALSDNLLEENYRNLVVAFGSENAKVTDEHIAQVVKALEAATDRTVSWKKVEEKQEEQDEGAPFVSLEDDQTNGLYTVTYTPGAKIRYRSGERDFDDYTGGKASVDTAVEQAIEGLDLTGSISFQYSRHDFQPSPPEIHNLQVQLGGSRNYHVGVGDTSSTLVIIEVELFESLRQTSPARLKKVLQAAHRYSFANRAKVEFTSA
jgi:hypothetical protein